MTREELIAQLRDIHFPPLVDHVPGLDFAIWPIALLAMIWIGIRAVRFWRRNAWRRDVRAALKRIESRIDRAEQWPALLDLAIKIAHVRGRATPLPAIAYRRPDQIGDADMRALVRHIRAETSR